MSFLNLNIDEKREDIIDAFTIVFGDEYNDVIAERVNNTKFLIYTEEDELEKYLDFMELQKRRELALIFLKEIGIDTCNQKSFADELNKDILSALKNYIGDDELIPFKYKYPDGLKAWMINTENIDAAANEIVIANKIKFLNYYMKNENAVTRENFAKFCTTKEYSDIENEIFKFCNMYFLLADEYYEFVEENSIYRENIENERSRKSEFMWQEKSNLYDRIVDYLPYEIIEWLESMTSSQEEVEEILFGEDSQIEYIIESIASEDDASKIHKIITDSYETAINRYIMSRKDFKRNYDLLEEDRKGNLEYLCLMQRAKGVKFQAAFNEKGEFIHIIFFTVGEEIFGVEEFALLHEICHSIETNALEKGCVSGFDISYIGENDLEEKNPYNPQKRKYENLNEIIVDIFTEEVIEKLSSQGKYIITPKENSFTKVEVNSSIIDRNLVKPFVDRYRKSLVKSRLKGNINLIYDTVGKENFEEFNDIINRIKYIEGIMDLSEKNLNNPRYVEYNELLQKLEEVYHKMEIYSLNGEEKEPQDVVL